jgi:hypothetical protein
MLNRSGYVAFWQVNQLRDARTPNYLKKKSGEKNHLILTKTFNY